MSKPIDGTDLSTGHQPNKNTKASTAAKSIISQNNLKTAQANSSAGEFIYNTMIPQSKTESAEVPLSSASPTKQLGRRQMSMDLKLKSDDFHLECDTSTAAEDGGVQLSNAKPCHVTSSDFVESYILAGEEEQPLKLAPSRPANVERISTGDSILKENLARMTSSDWKIEEDFRDESSVAMKDLLEKTPRPCMGTVCAALQRLSTADMDVEDGNISNIRMASGMSSDWVQDFKGQQSSDMVPIRPSLFDEKAASERRLVTKKPLPYTDQLVPTPDAAMSKDASLEIKSSSSSEKKTKKKKKKKRERVIDEGHVCIPTDDDVLFGRGGYTNSHPGNIRFRAKALEFRPMYEQSTKEEKYQISQLLLESVMNEGARFLEKGKDDQWHQVIGNGARKKASQALRERIKGTPRRSTKLSSSLKSTRSRSPKFEAPPEMTEDTLPAGVDELVPV